LRQAGERRINRVTPPNATRLLPLRTIGLAALLDVIAVVVFVSGGRGSHEEGAAITGTARTAWPFLVGLIVAWLVLRVWRTPFDPIRTGLPVVAITVVVGMILRVISGQGTAFSFIIVTGIILCLLMVGWRLIATWILRRMA
jgi:peptidoglycan/LPS O-acetylase OafA/YrhL